MRAAAIRIALLAGLGSTVFAGESQPRPADVVATVGGAPISAAELEQSGAARLFGLRTQEYQLKRSS